MKVEQKVAKVLRGVYGFNKESEKFERAGLPLVGGSGSGGKHSLCGDGIRKWSPYCRPSGPTAKILLRVLHGGSSRDVD